jgi:hypothetical protein
MDAMSCMIKRLVDNEGEHDIEISGYDVYGSTKILVECTWISTVFQY